MNRAREGAVGCGTEVNEASVTNHILFTIRCTTCSVLLQVRSEAAIGQLLICPKCGCLVKVEPPPGWSPAGRDQPGETPGTPATKPTAPAEHPAPSLDTAAVSKPAEEALRPRGSELQRTTSPQPENQARAAPAESPPQPRGEVRSSVSHERPGPGGVPAGDRPEKATPRAAEPSPADKAQAQPPKILAPATQAAATPFEDRPPLAIRPVGKMSPGAEAGPPSEQTSASTEEAAVARRSWLYPALTILGTVLLVGALGALLWLALAPRRPVAEVPPAAPEQGDKAAETEKPPGTSPPLPPRPWWWDWVAPQTRAFVYGDFRAVPAHELFALLALLGGAEWQSKISSGLESLRLRPEALAELLWVQGDWSAGPPRLMAVKLLPGHSTQGLSLRGTTAGFSLGHVIFRTDPQLTWPPLFAAVDTQTAVAGDKPLLEDLAQRGSIPAEPVSPIMAKLWKQVPADAVAVGSVDLADLRKTGWNAPVWLGDVWPEVAPAWRVICHMPVGLVGFYRDKPQPLLQLGLLCPSPTAASQLSEALASLRTFTEDLNRQLVNEGLPPELGLPLHQQAGGAQAALWPALLTLLVGLKWEVVEDFVWLRLGLTSSLLEPQHTSFDDWYQAAQARWLMAGLKVDISRHEAIQKALIQFRGATGGFPPGAGGATLLPPETRLSWIALLLPQLGFADWHKELNLGYSWNSAVNRPVTQRELPAVINPSLGPRRMVDGFPVTHYVGVGGVGPDAPKLPATNPRAGVFGYDRTLRLEDIPDGASNTAAIFGVCSGLGPWAAGGAATVRPLTQPPYVNGPDGFGSGQPAGMLVGMADGSVRFISAHVDPKVIEQLAAIGDGAPRSTDVLVAAASSSAPSAVASSEAKDQASGATPASQANNPSGQPKPAPSPSPESPEKPAGNAPTGTQNLVDLVALRLSSPVEEVRANNLPLADVARSLSRLANVPVTFDLEALNTLGVSPTVPVNAEIRPGNFEKAFTALAEQCGLFAAVDAGHVVFTISPRTRSELVVKTHDVRELLPATSTPTSVSAGQSGSAAAEPEELARLVSEFVWPDSWKQNGGRGTVSPQGSSLQVEQTELVHRAVAKFLDKLRVARQKKGAAGLKTKLSTAAPLLAKRVTVNFFQPVPLSRILRELERQTQVTLLVNWRLLSENGLWPEPNATLCVQDQPLGQTLEQLLLPLGLGYRVIEPTVFEVSTLKAISSALEVEFYPVGELLRLLEKDQAGSGPGGEVLMETISAQIASDTWSDAGGPAKMYLDRHSEHLIVLQSQPIHRELEERLKQLRSEWSTGGAAIHP